MQSEQRTAGAPADGTPDVGTSLWVAASASPDHAGVGARVTLAGEGQEIRLLPDGTEIVRPVTTGSWALSYRSPAGQFTDATGLLSDTAGIGSSFVPLHSGAYEATFSATWAGKYAYDIALVVTGSTTSAYAGPDIPTLGPDALANVGDVSPSGRCVAVAGSPSNHYALSHGGGLWRATDGAWNLLDTAPVPNGLDNRFRLAVDPTWAEHVAVAGDSGAFTSRDGGASWQLAFDPTTAGAPSTRATAVAFNDTGDTLYVGTDAGVAAGSAPGSGNRPFALAPAGGTVTAIAVTATKVWARTPRTLVVSSDDGATWSAPIPIEADFPISPKEYAALAATDDFAYVMTTRVPGTQGCGGDNILVIYDAATGSWVSQAVTSSDKNPPQTCNGTGGDNSLDGGRFVKSIRVDANLPPVVGQGIQLLYGAGQEVWRARGQNRDGTITDWNWMVGTQGPGYSNRDAVHADIWDAWLGSAPTCTSTRAPSAARSPAGRTSACRPRWRPP